MLLAYVVPLAAAAEPLASDVPKKLSGTVLEVTAGDQFIVLARNTRYKIHLDAVAAPLPAQPFAEEAREALERTLLGRMVEVTCVSGSRSAGIVGRVWSASKSINKHAIEQGWAWYDPSAVKSAALAAAQQAAREQALGLWQGADPVAPWEWRQQVAESADVAAETEDPMPSEGDDADAAPSGEAPPVEAVAEMPADAAERRQPARRGTAAPEEPEKPETNERPPRDARRGNSLIRLPTPEEARQIERRYNEERRRRNAESNRPQAPAAPQRRPPRGKNDEAAPTEAAEVADTGEPVESDGPAESVADNPDDEVPASDVTEPHEAMPLADVEGAVPQDEAADAQEPDAATADEGYTALREDYDARYAAFVNLEQDSPQNKDAADADPRAEFAVRFLELAESQRGSDKALEPLLGVCELSAGQGTGETVSKAVAQLREDHIDAPQLADAVRMLSESREFDPAEFFEFLAEKSPHEDVKGIALYHQAVWLARGELTKELRRKIDRILLGVMVSYRDVPYQDSILGEHARKLSEAVRQ